MKKEFSKFFVASLKRTAQNVGPLVRKKQKLIETIEKAQEEIESLTEEINSYQAPIIEATGGFGVEDLVQRVVEVTDKVDKDGKPIKATKWVLKYPETIVPVKENVEEVAEADDDSMIEAPATEDGFGNDFDVDAEESEKAEEVEEVEY